VGTRNCCIRLGIIVAPRIKGFGNYSGVQAANLGKFIIPILTQKLFPIFTASNFTRMVGPAIGAIWKYRYLKR
jgi:hypothetical protein